MACWRFGRRFANFFDAIRIGQFQVGATTWKGRARASGRFTTTLVREEGIASDEQLYFRIDANAVKLFGSRRYLRLDPFLAADVFHDPDEENFAKRKLLQGCAMGNVQQDGESESDAGGSRDEDKRVESGEI